MQQKTQRTHAASRFPHASHPPMQLYTQSGTLEKSRTGAGSGWKRSLPATELDSSCECIVACLCTRKARLDHRPPRMPHQNRCDIEGPRRSPRHTVIASAHPTCQFRPQTSGQSRRAQRQRAIPVHPGTSKHQPLTERSDLVTHMLLDRHPGAAARLAWRSAGRGC
jgi:hypothetical protein